MARSHMGRQAIKGMAEEDAYTKWRRMYCYLDRAGVVKAIKRTTHKRLRRGVRTEIRKELSC